MGWKHQIAALCALLVFLLVALAFVLGIAFGASVTSEQFSNAILPVLNVAGSWISGAGALGAVVVALWLAERQRILDRENLKIEFNFVVSPPNVSDQFLMISIVSIVNKPSIINSITFHCEGAKTSAVITAFQQNSSPLPIQLAYGQKATYLCVLGFEKFISKYLNEYAAGKAEKFQLSVNTNTESFRFEPSKDMKKLLTEIAAREMAKP